jgi:molybdate transport system ATP-binding protein
MRGPCLPENLQSEQLAAAAAQPVETHVRVQLRHRIGTLEIDVDFKLTRPWTILFGPSGSGKTTILRAIAGLLRPDQGRIVVTTMPMHEQPLTLVDTDAGVFLPAHQRHIRLAPQQPCLFPHMKVMENIWYGAPLSLNRHSEPGGIDGMPGVLEDFELAHTSSSLPHRLSGGEAQRVNLARAVAATGSRLLLFDEPFTGMDARRRDRLLPLLQETLAKRCTPVLSVTHDVAEAFQLGAEVIELAEGRVIDHGPVEVVLAEQRAELLRQLNGAARSPA